MSDRRMVYPYTIMAKIRNVPLKWYYNNNIYLKCFFWGFLLNFPLMWKLQQLSLSEGNMKALEEYRRREALEFEEHKWHLQ